MLVHVERYIQHRYAVSPIQNHRYNESGTQSHQFINSETIDILEHMIAYIIKRDAMACIINHWLLNSYGSSGTTHHRIPQHLESA